MRYNRVFSLCVLQFNVHLCTNFRTSHAYTHTCTNIAMSASANNNGPIPATMADFYALQTTAEDAFETLRKLAPEHDCPVCAETFANTLEYYRRTLDENYLVVTSSHCVRNGRITRSFEKTIKRVSQSVQALITRMQSEPREEC